MFTNLVMVGLFGLVLLVAMASNWLLGTVFHTKVESIKFKRKLFLEGLYRFLCVLFGVAALVVALTAVVELCAYYEVVVDQEVAAVINPLAIAGTFVTYTISYAKKAFVHLTNIISRKKQEAQS